MKEEIEEIASRINRIIDYQIEEARKKDIKYKYPLMLIIEEINRHIVDAEDLIEDYKQQKLTLNQLEAEGGLRALIQLRNEINYSIFGEVK
jgi:hypothetical protein